MSSLEGSSQKEYCGLCLQEGGKKEASYFCENCESYICDSCKSSHKKFQELRNHIIMPNITQQHDDTSGPSDETAQLSQLSTQPSESINAPSETSKPEDFTNVADKSSKPSTSVSETETISVTTPDEPADSGRTGIPNEIQGLKDAKFNLATKVNIGGAGDKRKPNIGGCCFMPGGELVLSDFLGHKVKLLDDHFNLKDVLENLKWGPFDVAALDNVTAAVTLEKEIQLITISPSLKKGRIISVGKNCYGIDVAANQIYVCCYTPGKENGEIRIYDFEGNLKKKIGKKMFSNIFEKPKYVSVSRSGEIFVIDGRIIKCLTHDRKIQFQFSGFNSWLCHYLLLPSPGGIYADDDGDVIVCNKEDAVVLITDKGRTQRKLISLRDPQCVTYRPIDGTLVVCCNDSDLLLVYKATKEDKLIKTEASSLQYTPAGNWQWLT